MTERSDTQVIQLVTKHLPWILLGLVIVLGGMTTVLFGLPWAQKTDVDKLAEIVGRDHETIQSISQTQAVAATQQAQTATILTQIQSKIDRDEQNTEANSIHIEGLEADEKARESHEALHSR